MALRRRKLAFWFARDINLGLRRSPLAGNESAQLAREDSRLALPARRRRVGFWRGFAIGLRELGEARAGVVSWPDHDGTR